MGDELTPSNDDVAAGTRPKNIAIFSDGTANVGGLLADELLTNVYKLYRAARGGPTGSVDPRLQMAFYDAGVGASVEYGVRPGLWRRAYNLLGSALGLGLTKNIIDCYAAILQVWRPGDRIYLIGFSRGAYTVRCVGGVLGLCGVPTRDGEGRPLSRDPKSLRALAAKAVKSVYQHGAGELEEPAITEARKERWRRAAEFRREHDSGDARTGGDHVANAVPYFIGVWDTVASVANVNVFLLLVSFAAAALLSFLGWLAGVGAWTGWFAVAAVVATGVAFVLLFVSRYGRGKSALSKFVDSWLPNALTPMRFYNQSLDPKVPFARHAMALDEDRADFGNVPWDHADRPAAGQSIKQVWFPGVHADVGGGYAENEARLSDIALDWMVIELQALPHPLAIDPTLLRRWPDPLGPQHDERKSQIARRSPAVAWLIAALNLSWMMNWSSRTRAFGDGAVAFHPSIRTRLEAAEAPHYDRLAPYRPAALAENPGVAPLYDDGPDARRAV
jgi:uncharacterized protein (DUF2235 family)